MHELMTSLRSRCYLSHIASATLGIGSISVVVVLLFWAVLPSAFQVNENSDYDAFYEPVARSILAGRGLVDGSGSVGLAYPPGYPLALAGVFQASEWLGISEGLAYKCLTLLCVGACSALLYLLSTLLWGKKAAVFAAILWMIYPPMLWLTKQPNSETVFLVPLFAALLLCARLVLGRQTLLNALGCGVTVGVSMLIRPIAIALVAPLIVGLCLCLQRERKLRVALLAFAMTLGSLTMIFPWAYWVYSNTGRLVPLSSSGVMGMLDGLTFALPTGEYERSVEVDEELWSIMVAINEKGGASTTVRDLIALQVSYFAKHPWTMARLYAHKMLRSWYATNTGRQETTLVLIQAIYMAIIVVGGFVALNFSVASRRVAIVIILVGVYFWAMTTLVLSILRYMVPAMGLLIVLAPGVLQLRPLHSRRWLPQRF
jgi:4-amino-4-deoxy-L-arabinose transferase-like glycosyltransferase